MQVCNFFFLLKKSVHTPDKQGKIKEETYFKELGPTSVNLLWKYHRLIVA